jgi:CubicO group peptidase (beta-lactamase class C family)
VLLLVVLAVLPVRAQNGASPNGLDEFINRAIKDWEVPGLAIAIVKDDRVVFAKGYIAARVGRKPDRGRSPIHPLRIGGQL